MPKLFRPKFTQSVSKPPVPKEAVESSTLSEPRSRSPSPPATRPKTPIKSPTRVDEPPPIAEPIQLTEISPPHDTTISNETSVDIDQQEREVADMTPSAELFQTKKIKRCRVKDYEDPPPATDKPLDRSNVSLRSLLNWVPTNKPPPLYRKERAERSEKPLDEIVPQKTVVKKSDDSVTSFSPIESPKLTPTHDMLAPQLRLDADGNIVLDETSLLVSIPPSTDVGTLRHVTEESGVLSVTYNSFRPTAAPRGNRWKQSETLCFYRALSTLGCDFYLMSKMFPNRSRAELLRKFKRESRSNPFLVNQALRNRRTYDLTALVPFSDDESEIEDTKPVKKPKVSRRTKKAGSNNPQLSRCDPVKIDETIDFVLNQNQSHSVTSPTHPTSSTHSPDARLGFSSLLDHMITKKRAEIHEQSCSEHVQPDNESYAQSTSDDSAHSDVGLSVSSFSGRPHDMIRLCDKILDPDSTN